MSYLFVGGLKEFPVAVTVQAVLKELGDGSLQGSVSEVLDICRSIKKAKDALSVPDFKALQGPVPFTTKVWSKLLQVGMDDRLEAIRSTCLPPTQRSTSSTASTMRNFRQG